MTCSRGSTIVLAAVLCVGPAATATEPFDPVAAGELPQYIFFNKSPSARGPDRWGQSRPDSFTSASMREIVTKIGASGNRRLRVGVTFPFSVLEDDPAKLAKSLESLLKSAETADVPVLIMLDGQNWWQNRSDLWNWWDPTLPGFDPANRFNVEWTGWGPQYAIKVSWRNWGQQIRVRPAPNIFSPRVMGEVRQRMGGCAAVIARWYRSLPAEKRYLFGGVKVGWEASLQVNAYHYHDGNRIFEMNPTDASRDPTNHDSRNGWTFGNAVLGYAAATSSGLKHAGELTKADHEKLIHRYLAELCRLVLEAGIPRHLIFTHQGGTCEPWDQHLSFRPAINEDSIPGWSFYSHDPAECGSLAADLESAGRRQWGAVEWWRGAADEAGWRERFRRTLQFKRCRLVAVYNWEPFREVPAAVAAVRGLMDEAASRPSD